MYKGQVAGMPPGNILPFMSTEMNSETFLFICLLDVQILKKCFAKMYSFSNVKNHWN